MDFKNINRNHSSRQTNTWAHLLQGLLPTVVLALMVSGCKIKGRTIEQITYRAQKGDILKKYPKVPHDEILNQMSANRLYTDLKDIYKSMLVAMKVEVEKDCAKLVIVAVSPSVGSLASPANNYGLPYIRNLVYNVGLDLYDLTDTTAKRGPGELALSPSAEEWNKAGTRFVAEQLAEIVKKNDSVRNVKVFSKESRPATFGDLTPKLDEIAEGEKSIPFHVKANSQGLRLDHEVKFPKTKQRILIMGGDLIFNPYLDNEYTVAAQLQSLMPDKEVIGVGMMHYNMEDFWTLYREKCRYLEPDLVIVCTNGDDILDNYFTQRNHYSRTQKVYNPTEAEAKFYDQLFNEK